jgi:hypothetical protein
VHDTQSSATALRSVKALIPETVDVYAVDYRADLLVVLHYVLSNCPAKLGDDNLISGLSRFKHGEDFEFCVIKVMARIPAEVMQLGFAYSAWPYDINDCIHEVEQEAAMQV